MAQEWSFMKRILSTCKNSPRKQDKSLVMFLENMELFLECGFMLLPGVEDRS